MTITVFIRYQLDPFTGAQFDDYAGAWLSIVPRCGGDLVGYWTPYEGANNIAYGLISFENLAAYEGSEFGCGRMNRVLRTSVLRKTGASSAPSGGHSCAS
jgi:hypothetical protein